VSPYLIVFLVLIGFAVYEYFQKKTQKRLYWIALGLLSVMLCLRYAQGTDYCGYYYNFLITPTLGEINRLFDGSIHGELGWLFICSLFRTLRIPFEVLVGLLSLLEMYCLHRFIVKFSPLRTVSLLLTVPTIYMTYCMSALRQGLVIMLFLGFMVDWLYRKRMIPYIIMTLACVLVHSSAAVFLTLFAMRWVKLDTIRTLLLIVLCSLGGIAASWILPKLSASVAAYAESGLSVLAIGERLVSTLLMMLIFRDVLDQKTEKKHRKLYFLLQIYLYGTLIYCFLMWSSLLSARFAVYFKAIEIAIFAVAIRSNTHLSKTVAVYLGLLTIVMYVKNVDAYIAQGQYLEHVNVFNYPYISVFWENAAESFRRIPYDFNVFLP